MILPIISPASSWKCFPVLYLRILYDDLATELGRTLHQRGRYCLCLPDASEYQADKIQEKIEGSEL